jgi:hypothetical protein
MALARLKRLTNPLESLGHPDHLPLGASLRPGGRRDRCDQLPKILIFYDILMILKYHQILDDIRYSDDILMIF